MRNRCLSLHLTLLPMMALLMLSIIGYAQPPGEGHTPFALKTQAYPVLSYLVQPLVGRYDLPLVPQYFTGAMEVGFGDRHAVEFKVAARRYVEPRWALFRDNYLDAAFHAYWGYRHYWRAEKWGRMAGPYWDAGLVVGSANLHFSCCEDIVVNSYTRQLAVGGHVGWQLKLWRHLLLDAAVGPQFGYQVRTEGYGKAFALDHVGFSVWERYSGGRLRYLLLGVDASMAMGWLF